MPGPVEILPHDSPELRPQALAPPWLVGMWVLALLCGVVGCGKGAYIDRMDKQVKALHDEAEAKKKKTVNSGRPNIPGADGDGAADGPNAAEAGAEGADGGVPPDEAAGGDPPAE